MDNMRKTQYQNRRPNQRFTNNRESNGDYQNKSRQFNNDRRGYNQNRNNNNQDSDDNLICEDIPQYVKKQVIEYLYKVVDVNRYKFKDLKFDSDLNLLTKQKYYVSPNYSGIYGPLIFIKIKDKYYSFIVEKKSLGFNQQDVSKVKMYRVRARVDPSIYQGTVLDGVLLYGKMNQSKTYVINDAYVFRGKNQLQEKMNFKMINLNTFFDNCVVQDQTYNTVNFLINKMYELEDIKKVVHTYIPNSKYSSKIKGIAFFPEISGEKLIYLFNNISSIKDETNQPVQQPIIVTPEKPIEFKFDGDLVMTFKMKKTDKVDVYQLVIGKVELENGKKLMKFKKYCIAHIPSTDASHYWNTVFKEGVDSVNVECQYLPDKDKWIPVKISNKKLPNTVDDINAIFNQRK